MKTDWTRTRYYVGMKKRIYRDGEGDVGLEVFGTMVTPTPATSGRRYSGVMGPFRTRRAAEYAATVTGWLNPHTRTIAEYERVARQMHDDGLL